ncbi:MAG: hypothetical protein H6557_22220 [Lewinellaceae bacterium]|nr:hypothetical protein [Lewinellaceae bacterium]
MEFNPLCEEVLRIYLAQEKSKTGDQRLLNLTGKVTRQLRTPYSLRKLDAFLDLSLSLAKERRPYQQFLLDAFLGFLHHLLFDGLWQDDLPSKFMPLDEALIAEESDARKKIMHQTALKLVPFAQELYHIQLPRDSYSNRRKAHAIKILGKIWDYYDTNEGIELCLDALKSKSEDLVIDTAYTLEEYYVNRKLPLSEEVLKLLQSQVKKSKHIYAVMACLKVMTSTGHITNGESEDLLGDWKERNNYPVF